MLEFMLKSLKSFMVSEFMLDLFACCKFWDGDGMGMELILTGTGGDGCDFCPRAGL